MRRIPEHLVDEFVDYALNNIGEFVFNTYHPEVIKVSTSKVKEFLENHGVYKYETWELATFMGLVSLALRKHGYVPIDKRVTSSKGRKTIYYFAKCANKDCKQYIETLVSSPP